MRLDGPETTMASQPATQLGPALSRHTTLDSTLPLKKHLFVSSQKRATEMVINCSDISSITKAAHGDECLMPVNHFKVGLFFFFPLTPLSLRFTLDRYKLMVPQIALCG